MAVKRWIVKIDGNMSIASRPVWLRLTASIIAVYVIIAALHGMAPGIWAKSYDGAEKHGPLRLLIFSPLLVLIYILAVLLLLVRRIPHPCPLRAFRSRNHRTAWSLRGPPHLS